MEKIDENILTDIIIRDKKGEIRKEEKFDFGDNEENALASFIEDFSSEIALGHEDYILSIDDFIAYIKDYSCYTNHTKYNVNVLINHIKHNWDDGEKICDEIDRRCAEIQNEYAEDNLEECGPVLGDLAGMGDITFPGECGEKGSGDLPMPTGRVCQQVAPFGTFIKIKKNKKKKKFRKEDEPCAKYSNPDVYKFVDDFRDYVDRTYNKIK